MSDTRELLPVLLSEKSRKIKGSIYNRMQVDFAYNSNHIEGWLIGALIGVGLLAVCVAAIMITGSISYEGLSKDTNIPMLMLMLGGFIIQGAAEEFLCRGLVFGSLKDKISLPVAIGASTHVFILPHMGTLMGSEPMFVILGAANLAVISCVFSFVTLCTKSILAACGLHSIYRTAVKA